MFVAEHLQYVKYALFMHTIRYNMCFSISRNKVVKIFAHERLSCDAKHDNKLKLINPPVATRYIKTQVNSNIAVRLSLIHI